jgi:hypothetical protein
MCWLTNASPPTTSVTAAFRSPPAARIGVSAGRRATAPGAYPRERRSTTGPNVPARAIESSTRRAMDRSPISHASAMPASLVRASPSSYAIGSFDALPLVMTSTDGAPEANSRWCTGVYGNMTPSASLSGAT